jgi:aspartyl-tRNA(Asn)/glutamyl-tRNA(Gln) amidotransferase subunit B
LHRTDPFGNSNEALQDLVNHLANTLPVLPDEQVKELVETFGLSNKDAKTIVLLDHGDRVDYFHAVVAKLQDALPAVPLKELGRSTANWYVKSLTIVDEPAADHIRALHELGGLMKASECGFTPFLVTDVALSRILLHLLKGNITGKTAKELLAMKFQDDPRTIDEIVEQDDVLVQRLTDQECRDIAILLVEQNPEIADKVRKGQKGKLQWFVGQMMRQSKGRLDAKQAAQVLEQLLRDN